MYPNPADALPLPRRPNLEQYKKQAKNLVKVCKSGDRDAIRAWAAAWIEKLVGLQGRVVRCDFSEHVANQFEKFARSKLWNPGPGKAECALTDAQFVIARAHGFDSWPKFSKHVAGLMRANSPDSHFESAVEAVIAGDVATLKRLLRENPELIRAHSAREHGATLLHYVAANGVESYRQKASKNAVEVAKLMLKAGAEVDAPNWPESPAGPGTALGLVATSVHPKRAGVHLALLETLLDCGAAIDGAPGGWNPLLTALRNGRPQAAEFLARRGARLDLEGAAGVGRLDLVQRFFNEDGSLKANATKAQMESGFMWACEYGRNNVVDFLLDKGLDLHVGENTDQTGLHWAVIGGQMETIQVLLGRGARLEAKNAYGGTVLDQALWSAFHDPEIDSWPIVESLIAAGAKVEPDWQKNIDEVRRRHDAKS